jgi:uncharacterized membrane protein YciS (DUF1049 family)
MAMGTYGSNLKIKAQIHIKYPSGPKLSLILSDEGEMRMSVMVSTLFQKGLAATMVATKWRDSGVLRSKVYDRKRHRETRLERKGTYSGANTHIPANRGGNR